MDQYVIKMLGRLAEGYGCKADHNKFYGGTMFRDAASKIIHIKNQVSLNAGKTVNAKLQFEEWLYKQAAVTVRHIMKIYVICTTVNTTDRTVRYLVL